MAVQRKWVVKDLDSRALGVTKVGEREFQAHWGLATRGSPS
jgi:hypothetical protein